MGTVYLFSSGVIESLGVAPVEVFNDEGRSDGRRFLDRLGGVREDTHGLVALHVARRAGLHGCHRGLLGLVNN